MNDTHSEVLRDRPGRRCGVRGAGEMGIVIPPVAIGNAIARATGVRLTELPMTPERVFWAIKGEMTE